MKGGEGSDEEEEEGSLSGKMRGRKKEDREKGRTDLWWRKEKAQTS